MSELLARFATPYAEEALATFPAVMIQGARQVGKSTFAQELVRGRPSRVLTLDDTAVLAAAQADPAAFVTQLSEGTLVIDELQRAPELMLALTASIDRDRRPGRFLLTSSSNLLDLSRTPDSLAGRAVTVELKSLSQGEIRGRADDVASQLRAGFDAAAFETDATRADYVEMIARGGYPEVRALRPRMRSVWFDSYVQRLMDRDVSDIAPRVDSQRIATVLRLLAANQAGELVKSRLARDAGLPERSAAAYNDLLETMYLSETLRPWTPSLTSREVGRSKGFIVDSGLALRLARLGAEQLVPLTSAHIYQYVEGFVVGELMRQRSWSETEYELFHYRERSGIEVDVVLEFSDGAVIGIEIEAGSTVKPEHFAGLRVLRDKLGDRFLGGYVLNTAGQGMSFGERLAALPIAALWEA
ncbi:MAG TPA: ATP-binding protein [Microbacterium sp.]|nr:ATP-binding protein [Microbacterium sp.]